MGDTLERLYTSGLKFLIPLTAEETFVMLVEEARLIIKAKYGTVLLLQDNKLTRVYTSIPFPLETTSREKGFSHKAFRSGEPLVVSAKDILPDHPDLKKIKLKRSVMVPLSYHNHELGVLILAMTTNRRITKKELTMLKIFGAIASLSIRKSQLYTQTKEALETRDLFISMVSHELKTPLTALNMYTHLLQKSIGATEGKISQWTQSLSQELTHLTRLINELLNIELLQTGKFVYHKKLVDVEEILDQAIIQCKVLFPFHTIEIKRETQDDIYFVDADPDKLLQVFQNLFANAAKFSPVEYPILVYVTAHGSHIKIEVVDRGIGIHTKEIESVFEKFYKGTNHYKEGVGLGLFLSKSIISSHNGIIAIHSEKEKGTKVTVSLPLLSVTKQ